MSATPVPPFLRDCITGVDPDTGTRLLHPTVHTALSEALGPDRVLVVAGVITLGGWLCMGAPGMAATQGGLWYPLDPERCRWSWQNAVTGRDIAMVQRTAWEAGSLLPDVCDWEHGHLARAALWHRAETESYRLLEEEPNGIAPVLSTSFLLGSSESLITLCNGMASNRELLASLK